MIASTDGIHRLLFIEVADGKIVVPTSVGRAENAFVMSGHPDPIEGR